MNNKQDVFGKYIYLHTGGIQMSYDLMAFEPSRHRRKERNFCENREFIQKSDVGKIISLKLANKNFYSLKGIEHFAAIEDLDCSFNKLTELEISKNVN